jgi:DNA-binding Lrp family transcriptional regulator
MAESPEHAFLKRVTTEVFRQFASLRLYGFTEVERRKFDLSCVIERDWSRPLVGQVLWHHVEGVEKDLRTLLTDADSEIKLYVAQDHIRTRQLLSDVTTDFRRSAIGPDLFRLKVIWVPAAFDADRSRDCDTVTETVRAQIVDDVLLNVVFGNLAEENVRLFLTSSGMPGVNLALLHLIRSETQLNISDMAKRLDISAGPVREKLGILHGAGLVTTPRGEINYTATSRGRVFLELIGRMQYEIGRMAVITSELAYVLRRLGCSVVSAEEFNANREVVPENMFVHLLRTADEAEKRWGITCGGFTIGADQPA